MKKQTRLQAKILIKLSNSIEEADDVIQQYLQTENTREKIAFLKGMFEPVTIIDLKSTDSDELAYHLMLDAIISERHLS